MIFLFDFRGEWGNWELMGTHGSYESLWELWELCEFGVARKNGKFRKVLAVRKFRKLRMC